jgi:hypothetical protein
MSDVLPAVVWHLGTLHTYEKLLVLLVAFGPFVVLSVVVHVVRKRDIAAEEAQAAESAGGTGPDEVSGRPPAT